MGLIDLHTHSTASDGTDSPAEVVQKAWDMGLEAVALTDHDTIEGLEEGEEAARKAGLEFIRGCEVSVSTEHGEMHILGLWLPRNCQPLREVLDNLRQRRNQRNIMLIERLQAHGIDITLEEAQRAARGNVGRPHVAALLLEKGVVKNREEAFSVWLGNSGKAYVPKAYQDPLETVRLLRSLGATVSLAHPLLRAMPAGWLDNFVGKLAANGLTCLEAWHSSHTPAKSREIIQLAKKYNLGLTGGSDYHGKNKPAISLGSGCGNVHVETGVLENLKQLRRAQGLPC